MIRSIPNINTMRLTLRGMRPEDFDRFAQIWAMPEVVRNIGGQPWDRGKAWESFLRNAGHWEMTGFGQWAVVAQSTRTLIGQTGFFFGSCELGDDFDPFPEAGWVLAPEAQGQGLGYEAAKAAHDWFDRVIPGPLVAMVNASNASSQKLAKKLGYVLMREGVYNETPVHLLRRNGPPALA